MAGSYPSENADCKQHEATAFPSLTRIAAFLLALPFFFTIRIGVFSSVRVFSHLSGSPFSQKGSSITISPIGGGVQGQGLIRQSYSASVGRIRGVFNEAEFVDSKACLVLGRDEDEYEVAS